MASSEPAAKKRKPNPLPAKVSKVLTATAAKRAKPTKAGYIDLRNVDGSQSSPSQNLMDFKPLSLIYNQIWRPALARAAKGVVGPSLRDEFVIASDLLDLRRGNTVLDVGCGPGTFTRKLANEVGSDGLAIGFDMSKPMLEEAIDVSEKAGFNNIHYLYGDATKKVFKRGAFDAILCFAALNLMSDPQAALENMRQALKPGGRIAIFTTAKSSIMPVGSYQTLTGQMLGVTFFGREELTERLRDLGFTDLTQKVYGISQIVGGRLVD